MDSKVLARQTNKNWERKEKEKESMECWNFRIVDYTSSS